MENKISVFGNTGFIGSKFCETYSSQTVKIDRESRTPLTDEILYFISTVDNYNIHQDLHIDINTNLNLLMSVLENLDKDNPNVVFNFISSWFVYGKNIVMPYNEDTSVCNPTGFYSITKRCAEQLLISFCETYNIKYRILRLANVLGEGDRKVSAKKNALQYLIKKIVKGEDINLYGEGDIIRDYIYVDDTVKAINYCLQNAPYNQIINIGNGIPYNLKDIVNYVVKKSNSTSKITNIPPPEFHGVVQIKDSYLDVTKLKSYGFKSGVDINTILDKLINFYINE